jgi:hypothetical protein
MNFANGLVKLGRMLTFMNPGPELREAKKMSRMSIEGRRAKDVSTCLALLAMLDI